MTKRSNKASKPTHEEFVFEVRRPSVSYGFSLQPLRHDPDAYWEYPSFEFVASCLHPDRFRGREALGRVSGDRDLMNLDLRRRPQGQRNGVGFMEAGKAKFELTPAGKSARLWRQVRSPPC